MVQSSLGNVFGILEHDVSEEHVFGMNSENVHIVNYTRSSSFVVVVANSEVVARNLVFQISGCNKLVERVERITNHPSSG